MLRRVYGANAQVKEKPEKKEVEGLGEVFENAEGDSYVKASPHIFPAVVWDPRIFGRSRCIEFS